ncbi:hypothetical protein AWB91_08990 [Mycobacterium paraense]|uniref:Uncharacterized protein n=1 Tax=Mycobacterium paraense TaxID=767916 RepID=A0ABX3VS20_9MYCO|nr:hypothetical protein [Mycobacterium paraense]ORW33252.1 hypothetical protein AWB91_08990 [Mycobacterium paraense]ORW34688.1 hypothetical protein AWB88_02790 [Mycobacterium paraense]
MTSNGHGLVGVEDIADLYLVCRDLGHTFRPYDVHITRTEIQRSLQCANCGTIRHQALTKNGYIIPGRSRYEYPEQQDPDAEPYCLKGHGRMTVDDRAQIRVMSSQLMKAEK